MPNNNLEIRTGAQNINEYVVTYQRNGYGGIIPVIDGVAHPELLMGFVSEADRDAGLDALRDALMATNGNIPQAMMYMYEACRMAAEGVKADEVATTEDGEEIVIDYENRKAYIDGEEVANLDGIGCELPREAIKALLIDKCK